MLKIDLSKYPEKLLKTAVTIFSFSFILIVFSVQITIGSQFALSVFYLIPISLTTWYVGRNAGIIASTVSIAVWLFADVYFGNHYSNRIIPYINEGCRYTVFIAINFLLSELSVRLRSESLLARTDSLTQVPNRLAFFELLRLELIRAKRYGGIFTIVSLDLDNFKYVNDNLGHQIGDEVLRMVARIIKSRIRTVDTIARIGGDEFYILMPCLDMESSISILTRLSTDLVDEMNKNSWPVTFSMGVLTHDHFGNQSIDELLHDLIKQADMLLYDVKNNGKNSIRFAATSITTKK